MDSETRALASRVARLENELSLLKGVQTINSTMEPSGIFEDGQLWYDNANGAMNVFQGGKFESMGGGKYKSGHGNKSAATGTVSITGVGFKPKFVRLVAVYADGGGGSMSHGSTDGTTVTCSRWFNTNGSFYTGATYDSGSDIIGNLQNNTGSTATIKFVSMDSDGFTLNWSAAAIATHYDYECFG